MLLTLVCGYPGGVSASAFSVAVPGQRTGSGAVERGFTITTAMYPVEGMMCESCMAAVVENIHSIPGVTAVVMDLVTGGQSPLIVTSGTKLDAHEVRGAVEQFGFGVPSPRPTEPRSR
jgi:copper chaperone